MASYNFLLECGLEVVLTDQLMMSRLNKNQSAKAAQAWCAPAVVRFRNAKERDEEVMPDPIIGTVSLLEDGTQEIYNGTHWMPYPERLVD